MKKTVRILLLTLVLALSLLALVSCASIRKYIPAYIRDNTPAHTHSYGQPATVAASCWQDGYKTYACLLCGQEKVVTLKATGVHSYTSGTIVYTEEAGAISSHKKCDVCGALSDPVHTYSTEWEGDGVTHWHEPTCGCPWLDPYGTAAHSFTSGTVIYVYHTEGGATTSITSHYRCDVCGKPGEPLHTYAGAWSSDAANHWHEPTCGCEGLLPYGTAAHTGPADSYTVSGEEIIAHKTCEVCGTPFTEAVTDAVVVTDTASAQQALDAAGDNTVIYFKSADYGKLYLRTVKERSECYTAGTKDIYYRALSGLTLLAEEGATFRSLAVETLSYPARGTHSLYPSESFHSVMSLYDLSLLGLHFTGEETALHLEGYYEIDGLTMDGCTIKRETPLGDDRPWLLLCKTDAEALTMGGELFTSSRRNITVKNCTVEGVHQAVELRGTENVTLVNNTVTNIAERCFLLSTTSTPYTGTVTITGNTVSGLGDRFFRATRLSGAKLVLTDNTVSGYVNFDGEPEEDIVKVTESTLSELVFENNDLPEDMTVTLPGVE